MRVMVWRAARTWRSRPQIFFLLCTLVAAAIAPATARGQSLEITLDAREAARGVLHAELTIPADSGPITLYYPKWIPGEHGPTGPVRDVVNLRMKAGGRELDWKRDPLDLYAFRTVVPAGAKSLSVTLDFLLPSEEKGFSAGRSSTDHLAILSWHYVLLYPAGRPVAQLSIRPRLIIPEGWQFGTALEQKGTVSGPSPSAIEFQSVSVATLVDSPVLMGRFFRNYQLTDQPVPHRLHIAADSEAALESSSEVPQLYRRVIEEALALFGGSPPGNPYDKYDFLLALSDHIALFGLEHHESSDNRLGEDALRSDGGRRGAAGMLAHEFVHSWNGKARRPAGMVNADFQQPQDTELLWIYEGLTDYLEAIIPVRAGLWSEQELREHLAITAGNQVAQSGRAWRSLEDTALSAQIQFEAPAAGSDRRRSIDFYDEASLIWLEVDATLRSESHGNYSLDDFCRRFLGKPAASIRTPKVATYKYEEMIETLRDLVRYDWEWFFRERVERRAPKAPLGGIEKSGWKLSFRDTLEERFRTYELSSGYSDFRHSLGLILNRNDDKSIRVQEVLEGSPAARAGVLAGMRVVAINTLEFSPEVLRQAIRAAQHSAATIDLLIERDERHSTLHVEYHGGERYPFLERVEGQPDLLEEIARPRGN
ncbi:MAG: M61 family peptidase [Acidobacteria bacterium]|nr:M61 family peptidase [Acidobacteriota bacterium]